MLLRDADIVFPRIAAPLVVDGLGAGYGHPSAAGEAARTRGAARGLALDPTYTAKAFAALPLLGAAGYRCVVFWHTFALPSRSPESIP